MLHAPFPTSSPVHIPFAPPSFRPSASRPATTSPNLVCALFGSAGSVSVQPAAGSRHVQRHRHGLHVSGALRACHAPSPRLGLILHTPSIAVALPPFRHLVRTSPGFVCPLFDTAGSVGVQPAAESRHVQSHKHGLHVSGALSPQSGISLQTACAAVAPCPFRLTGRTSPSLACPSF